MEKVCLLKLREQGHCCQITYVNKKTNELMTDFLLCLNFDDET